MPGKVASGLCLFLPTLASAGIVHVCMQPHLAFHMIRGHPDLGSHAFVANNFMTKPALAPWCEVFFFLIKICMILGNMLPLLRTQLLSTQKAKVEKQSKFPSGKLESYYAA